MSSDIAEQCTRCNYWLSAFWNWCPRCGTKLANNKWEDPEYTGEESDAE